MLFSCTTELGLPIFTPNTTGGTQPVPSPLFLPKFIEAWESEDGVWPLVKKPAVLWFRDASCIPLPLLVFPASHSPSPTLPECNLFRGPICYSPLPVSLFELWWLLASPRYLYPPWLGKHQSTRLSPLAPSHWASLSTRHLPTQPQFLLRGLQKEILWCLFLLASQPFPVLIHSRWLYSNCVKNPD